MKCLFVFILLLGSLMARAQEHVSICFNYSCRSQADVVYQPDQLLRLSAVFRTVRDAEQERAAIGKAVGLMLAWAGEQSPISADRGGNVADEGVSGAMDCIDHSTTTTRVLQLIEKKGLLRYHRVLDIVQRRRFLLFDHFSAQIEEVEGDNRHADTSDESQVLARYVVDSWFFDNGHPAAVMPLERWLAGESPDVSD